MREVEWETLKMSRPVYQPPPAGSDPLPPGDVCIAEMGYIAPAEAAEAFYANLTTLDMVA